jgi:hypothetical protein
MLLSFRPTEIIKVLGRSIPKAKKKDAKNFEYGGTFKSVIRKKIRITIIKNK